ncbi:MAG: hypothetical protein Q8P88_02540 [Candidatus Jorgensenbacteria bacterium]|nr:hypothetical protein [Candidatus Jorgensenbacteria bacterium]
MKTLLTSKPLLVFTAISALLLVIAGLALFLHWNDFPSRVVLHFAPLEGADLFGTRADVLTLWILGAAVAAVNVFLAEVFYDRSRELSYLFGGINVLLMLILLIAIGTIVSVN